MTKILHKIKDLIWPVYPHETMKVLSMSISLFFLAISYHQLRQMKDSVIFVLSGRGVEVIPFIKVWGLLPASTYMTYLFSKIKNRFSAEHTVYVIISIFLIYFTLFLFLFYPCREFFTATSLSNKLASILPKGAIGLSTAVEYWYASIFFIMAELWGSIVLQVAFWGFANETMKMHAAKRIYSIFCLSISLAGVTSGLIGSNLTYYYSDMFPFGNSPWEQGLFRGGFFTIFSALIAILSFRQLNNRILLRPASERVEVKDKRNFWAELKTSARSPYILCLSCMMFGFGFISSSVELLWKENARLIYSPESGMFSTYMAKIITFSSLIAAFMSIFLSGWTLRRFGWTFTALITPIAVTASMLCLFLFSIFPQQLECFAKIFNSSSLQASVFFGSVTVLLGRACKYSMFDGAKEMAFIPLEPNQKSSAKTLVDGLISRLGKSGSSIMYSSLLLTVGSISAATPTVAIVCTAVSVMWILCVLKVGKTCENVEHFQEPIKDGNEQD